MDRQSGAFNNLSLDAGFHGQEIILHDGDAFLGGEFEPKDESREENFQI